MGKIKTIEDEINAFLDVWDCKQICQFLRDIIPLLVLFDVDDEDDWIEKETGGDEEEVRTLRLIRTVYLISKIAEGHTGKLAEVKIKFKYLYRKMEKLNIGQENEME